MCVTVFMQQRCEFFMAPPTSQFELHFILTNSQICDLFPHYSSDHAGILFLFLIKEQI